MWKSAGVHDGRGEEAGDGELGGKVADRCHALRFAQHEVSFCPPGSRPWSRTYSSFGRSHPCCPFVTFVYRRKIRTMYVFYLRNAFLLHSSSDLSNTLQYIESKTQIALMAFSCIFYFLSQPRFEQRTKVSNILLTVCLSYAFPIFYVISYGKT